VVLEDHGEVEQTMRQKSDDFDVQEIGTFIIGSGYRRGLMSGYLDGKRVSAGADERFLGRQASRVQRRTES
jgi:hypothetical protein